jgi:hypothetical protein
VCEEMIIVFDAKLMRPACVLLQAAFGADNFNVANLFDAKLWLVAPTPDMKRFEVTKEQLQLLVKKVEEYHATRR